MSSQAQQEFAGESVCGAARCYIASRRARINPFVDRHFTFVRSSALHRHAIGWDLLRAPANLFLAGSAFGIKLLSWAARRVGSDRLAAWLTCRRLLLETDVAREIE